MHCVTSALMEYLKVDLIPKHPAACHELGIYVYPHIHLEGNSPSQPSSDAFPQVRSSQKLLGIALKSLHR